MNAIRDRDRDRAAARALSLVQLGDALSSARPPGWPHRARRAYVKATRILAPDAEAPSSVGAAALRARELAAGHRKPVKAAALRLGAALFVVVVAVLALLYIAVPRFRALVAPDDLAKDAAWEASSKSEGFPQRGFTPRGLPLFFQTASQVHPWLKVDLPREVEVSAIRVDNRRDCCGVSALPLNVEILDEGEFRLVCQRRAAFSSYTCRFPPARTSAVRVTLAGKGVLHLSRIAVYE